MTYQSQPIPPMGPKVLLLVEDDPFIFEIYQRKFSLEGHTIVGAHSGEEALQKLQDAETPRPDIILCDVIMPGMGGFEFLRRKVELPTVKDIPVIMLTNVAEREHFDLAEKYGAIGYIIKANYTPSDVLRKVGKFLYKWTNRNPDEPFFLPTV